MWCIYSKSHFSWETFLNYCEIFWQTIRLNSWVLAQAKTKADPVRTLCRRLPYHRVFNHLEAGVVGWLSVLASQATQTKRKRNTDVLWMGKGAIVNQNFWQWFDVPDEVGGSRLNLSLSQSHCWTSVSFQTHKVSVVHFQVKQQQWEHLVINYE